MLRAEFGLTQFIGKTRTLHRLIDLAEIEEDSSPAFSKGREQRVGVRIDHAGRDRLQTRQRAVEVTGLALQHGKVDASGQGRQRRLAKHAGTDRDDLAQDVERAREIPSARQQHAVLLHAVGRERVPGAEGKARLLTGALEIQRRGFVFAERFEVSRFSEVQAQQRRRTRRKIDSAVITASAVMASASS